MRTLIIVIALAMLAGCASGKYAPGVYEPGGSLEADCGASGGQWIPGEWGFKGVCAKWKTYRHPSEKCDLFGGIWDEEAFKCRKSE